MQVTATQHAARLHLDMILYYSVHTLTKPCSMLLRTCCSLHPACLHGCYEAAMCTDPCTRKSPVAM